MSEERLQEIKDSISLQYKVQEANGLNNFNIFTDEEQELVDEIERLQKENQILMNSMVTEAHTKETKEIERLNNIIGEAIEYIEERYNGEVLTHTFDKDNVGELLNILKGVDKE